VTGLVARPPGDRHERLDAVIHGRVQAVGYRVFAARLATDLGLSGWVANQPDGSVRCVAEGMRPALERLLAGLRAGPAGARVESVTETWGSAVEDLDGFRIRSHAHPGD